MKKAKEMIEKHYKYTESAVAKEILNSDIPVVKFYDENKKNAFFSREMMFTKTKKMPAFSKIQNR